MEIVLYSILIHWTEFDKLNVFIAKTTSGFDKIPIPKDYIKTIVELENLVQDNKTTKKKLNAANNKAMNGMKQKLKKVGKQYEPLVEAYKKVNSYMIDLNTYQQENV